MSIAFRLAGLIVVATMAACGGGGGGVGGGAVGNPDDNGGVVTPAPDGSPPTVGARCQDFFGPDRIDSGENCAPEYHAFCDSIEGKSDASGAFEVVPPCDGVTIEVVSEASDQSFSGQMDYIVLRPSTGTPRAVVTALHYRQMIQEPLGAAASHAAQMRMAELAKGRNVMVIVPGAPGGNWQQTEIPTAFNDLVEQGLGDLPITSLLGDDIFDNPISDALLEAGLPLGTLDTVTTIAELNEAINTLVPVTGSVEDYLEYIRVTRDAAMQRFGGDIPAGTPQFVNGLSNGGTYALRLACRHPDEVDAVMSVASTLGLEQAAACMSGEPQFGTVLVHGIQDSLVPYRTGFGVAPRGGVPPAFEALAPAADELGLEGLLPVAGVFRDIYSMRNRCSGDILGSIIPAGSAGEGSAAGDVAVERFANCDNSQRYRNYMVTVEAGGHNWPGFDSPFGNERNVFGVVSQDFDATLYGFDLMWRAAGLD